MAEKRKPPQLKQELLDSSPPRAPPKKKTRVEVQPVPLLVAHPPAPPPVAQPPAHAPAPPPPHALPIAVQPFVPPPIVPLIAVPSVEPQPVSLIAPPPQTHRFIKFEECSPPVYVLSSPSPPTPAQRPSATKGKSPSEQTDSIYDDIDDEDYGDEVEDEQGFYDDEERFFASSSKTPSRLPPPTLPKRLAKHRSSPETPRTSGLFSPDVLGRTLTTNWLPNEQKKQRWLEELQQECNDDSDEDDWQVLSYERKKELGTQRLFQKGILGEGEEWYPPSK